jgi:excisionase family DNA binding protein
LKRNVEYDVAPSRHDEPQTVEQVAKRCQVSPRTVYRLLENGGLRWVSEGGRLLDPTLVAVFAEKCSKRQAARRERLRAIQQLMSQGKIKRESARRAEQRLRKRGLTFDRPHHVGRHDGAD